MAPQLGPPSVAEENLEAGDGEELSHLEPAAVFTLSGAIGDDADGDGEELSQLELAGVFTVQGAVWMMEGGGRDSKGRLDAHVHAVASASGAVAWLGRECFALGGAACGDSDVGALILTWGCFDDRGACVY